jgi:hypothetical protein
LARRFASAWPSAKPRLCFAADYGATPSHYPLLLLDSGFVGRKTDDLIMPAIEKPVGRDH